VRKANNLPLSCAVVTKSRSLNFLEPSGPVQACNGTALPLDRYTHLQNATTSNRIYGIQEHHTLLRSESSSVVPVLLVIIAVKGFLFP